MLALQHSAPYLHPGDGGPWVPLGSTGDRHVLACLCHHILGGMKEHRNHCIAQGRHSKCMKENKPTCKASHHWEDGSSCYCKGSLNQSVFSVSPPHPHLTLRCEILSRVYLLNSSVRVELMAWSTLLMASRRDVATNVSPLRPTSVAFQSRKREQILCIYLDIHLSSKLKKICLRTGTTVTLLQVKLHFHLQLDHLFLTDILKKKLN